MDNATTMRNGYERISDGDIDGFGALLAANFVGHEETPGLPTTKAGTIEFFRQLRAAFPDLRMDVEDLISGTNRTVARVRATGTHQEAFMGMAPTGARVDIQLIDIMRFDTTGLVCEHWGVSDMLGLMQQIGAVPAGPSA